MAGKSFATIPVNIPNTYIPISSIPPTPRPRALDNIYQDAKERFMGVMMIHKNNNYSLEDYFLEYDFWELYSENKSYSKRMFSAAYKGIMREYHNYLCILSDFDKPDKADQTDEYYVVAKRVPGELMKLEEFCTCLRCNLSFWDPFKYLWCPTCTGCIKAGKGYAKQKYIDKAVELQNLKEHNQLTLSKYFTAIRWSLMLEGSILAIIAAIVYR